MLNIDIGDIATWVATAVSIASAVAAVKSSRTAESHLKEATQQARKNADFLERQHDLKLREWTDQYFNSVRTWAENVCIAISEATHIFECKKISKEEENSILMKLSALIDTGRWYFPNQWADDYGIHKEPAYRGVRQPILDCVVTAYDALKDLESEDEARSTLKACQREFVSYIQEVLDPRKRDQEIKKILSEFEVSERLRTTKKIQKNRNLEN